MYVCVYVSIYIVAQCIMEKTAKTMSFSTRFCRGHFQGTYMNIVYIYMYIKLRKGVSAPPFLFSSSLLDISPFFRNIQPPLLNPITEKHQIL